jgi:hypothetical protein
MIQLLGEQHLLGGNEATVDLLLLDMILETILVNLAIGIVIRLNVQIGNVIAPFKPPVSLSIWTKMTTMMIGLPLPMVVTQIDYYQPLLNVHIAIQLSQSIRLFWITKLINRSANLLRFHFFLIYVPNAKGDEALVLIAEVVISLLLRDNCIPIKHLSIVLNMWFKLLLGMNKLRRMLLFFMQTNILPILLKQVITQFSTLVLVFRLSLLKSLTTFNSK